jgi:hypothetical protein
MVNGEEIAWARATSASSVTGKGASFLTANGAYYLVKTFTPAAGSKNKIEIVVDGVVISTRYANSN